MTNATFRNDQPRHNGSYSNPLTGQLSGAVRGDVAAKLGDSWCRATWRSRPGAFVSLMTLYESNYIRLAQLLGPLNALPEQHVSTPAADCPLHFAIDERSRYTTTFTLTYRFMEADVEIADPDLQIRVYHDARLGEALHCSRWYRYPLFSALQSAPHREMDERWQRNMMLNKWLEYCADRGHQFTANSVT